MLRKANSITKLAKNPWREDKEGSFSLRCGWKTPQNKSRKNPCYQIGTENPIHIAPGGIRTGVLEEDGKERDH